MDAMIQSLKHAASLAKRRCDARLAVPEKVSIENASQSMNPRSTKRIRMTLRQVPLSWIHFHFATYRDVMMLRADFRSHMTKQSFWSHVFSSASVACETASALSWISRLVRMSSSLTTTALFDCAEI